MTVVIKKKLHNNLLADFVVRLNNALNKKSEFVYVPYSVLLLSIIRLFLFYGCISSFNIEKKLVNGGVFIKVYPRFTPTAPIIRGIKLVSKPGLRVFWSVSQLVKKFSEKNFQGFFVISTHSGIHSSSELFSPLSLNYRVSGEILLSVHF